MRRSHVIILWYSRRQYWTGTRGKHAKAHSLAFAEEDSGHTAWTTWSGNQPVRKPSVQGSQTRLRQFLLCFSTAFFRVAYVSQPLVSFLKHVGK